MTTNAMTKDVKAALLMQILEDEVYAANRIANKDHKDTDDDMMISMRCAGKEDYNTLKKPEKAYSDYDVVLAFEQKLEGCDFQSSFYLHDLVENIVTKDAIQVTLMDNGEDLGLNLQTARGVFLKTLSTNVYSYFENLMFAILKRSAYLLFKQYPELEEEHDDER